MNQQSHKLQKIKFDTCPEEKIFMCLNDLKDFGEINLSAIGTARSNLLNVLELLEIKRPNLYRYINTEGTQGKRQHLIVKLTMNKLKELPEGFSKLKEDEINELKNQRKKNAFLDLLEVTSNNTVFRLIKEKIRIKSEEIMQRQNNYFRINNRITEITILYYAIKTPIKIFGREFVGKNKKLCKIKYKGEEMPLTDTFILNQDQKDNILEIKLKGVDRISDMRFMFYNCSDLLAVPDICFLDTSQITNMGSLFNKCTSLISLPDISYWNLKNVTDISYMFAF